MPFIYDLPPTSGALRQGEILGEVYEHRPNLPASRLPEGSEVHIVSIHHERVVVLSPDCDLFQDYNRRSELQAKTEAVDPSHRQILPTILICDLYGNEKIRMQMPGSDVWRRVEKNQDERYHKLTSAGVGNPASATLSDLYMDFKKSFSIPTEGIYWGIQSGDILRIAVVPVVYLQDVVHRYFSFQSRVGLPD